MNGPLKISNRLCDPPQRPWTLSHPFSSFCALFFWPHAKQTCLKNFNQYSWIPFFKSITFSYILTTDLTFAARCYNCINAMVTGLLLQVDATAACAVYLLATPNAITTTLSLGLKATNCVSTNHDIIFVMLPWFLHRRLPWLPPPAHPDIQRTLWMIKVQQVGSLAERRQKCTKTQECQNLSERDLNCEHWWSYLRAGLHLIW